MQDEVAIHEDDDVVLAKPLARHGAQDQRDGDALAGLVLANDPQSNIEIRADKLQMPGDLLLVGEFT